MVVFPQLASDLREMCRDSDCYVVVEVVELLEFVVLHSLALHFAACPLLPER